MKLLGIVGSPYVTRVKFALKLKSIEYEYIEEDLYNRSELLLTSNPFFKRVPVLVCDNNQPPIAESLAIIEYLDEIRPDVHPLLPSSPSDRGQSRVWAYTFDALFSQWIRESMVSQDKETREEKKKLIIEGMVMLEQVFGMLSKGKAFFGGDYIGYLDIAIGSFLGWMDLFEIELGYSMFEEARFPGLAKWRKNMWSDEVARSVIPGHEINVKLLKFHRDLRFARMRAKAAAAVSR